MSGPWEKYAEKDSAPTNDGPWAKYQQKNKENDLGDAAQAGLEHFGNAASFGYMPQIQGIVSQLVPDPNADLDAKLKEQGFTVDQKKSNYIDDRDAYIKHLQEQEKDHPVASAVGTVGGSLASGIATSGLTPINSASRLGRLGQAVKAGAIIGAVSNPGDKEGEVSGLQLNDRAANAGIGAGMGALGQGVIEGLSAGAKGVTGLASALTNKAEERAFKASGAMLKDYRSAYGQDRINKIGRFMLDNGLIKPGMTVDEIAKEAENLAKQKGANIGGILNKFDEVGAEAPSHADIASMIENQAAPLEQLHTARPTYNALQDVAADVRAMGRGGAVGPEVKGSFNDAQSVKNFINEQIEKVGGWKTPNPSEKNLALRQAYGQVKTILENSADKAAQSIGDDSILGNYKDAKEAFRNATDVSGIANDQVLRKNANRFFSPSDYMSTAAGMAAGSHAGGLQSGALGLAAGVANKVARTYGTPLVSLALDKAGAKLGASALPEIGEMIAPALRASERSRISPAAVEGILSTPNLERSAAVPNVADKEQSPERAPSNLKGEALWAMNGVKKLGLDEAAAQNLLGSKQARTLLIEASDLPAGSKRLQAIKLQLQGRGNN